MLKCFVVGTGTIGFRVIDLIKSGQNQASSSYPRLPFELLGYTKRHSLHPLQAPFYLPTSASQVEEAAFKKAGFFAQGTLIRALDEIAACGGVVIDCTPPGQGKNSQSLYQEHSVRVIFNGGEDPNDPLIDLSFFAPVNYGLAARQQFLRIPSCNETGLLTIITTLQDLGLARVTAALVRRAADLSGANHDPLNSLVPKLGQTHHQKGIVAVLGDKIKIRVQAVKAPTTLMHIHMLWLEFNQTVQLEEVLTLLSRNPRILLISREKSFANTADIMEWGRRYRRHGDVYEVVIWEDSITLDSDGDDCILQMQVAIHQEAVVIPTLSDALLALSSPCPSATYAMRWTDKVLGIGNLRI